MRQRIWEQPQTLHDAATRLENLAALIQFITDLSSQEGTPPQSGQYTISDHGWFGMYLFHTLLQEEIEQCMEIVYKNVNKEEVRHADS